MNQKADSSKVKTFAMQKTLWRGWKDKLNDGRNYLQTTYLTNDSYLVYTKNPENLTVKIQATLLKNEQKTWRDISKKIFR